MIELKAQSSAYGNNHQYCARITGRHPKFTFEREFIGKKEGRGDFTCAYVDEPGLYMECDIDKKGRKDETYYVVLSRTADTPALSPTADPDLLQIKISESDAVAVAKRIEGGEALEQIVGVTKADGKYRYELRTKSEAKRASAAATVDSAVAHCWDVLQSLPEREAKKVLAELKLRISPPKPKEEAPAAGMTYGEKND